MVMNTDPSDIEEDIGGPEHTIDIYVLCGNSQDAEALGEQLAPQGYRVTLFTESTHLLQSLRDGKSNLLICDTTSPELNGYEFCREVKNDWDLWMVPVLLITGISGLGDLLKVLDCNADNFIIRPYNIPYLLSVVDSTISTPPEKPDPDKIKTQFKIRYDENEYIISADRRKLLELLLSAFEIAVQQAADSARITANLTDLASTLEQRVTKRTQDLSGEIERLNVAIKERAQVLNERESVIRKKEDVETTLRMQIQEQETIISEKIAELLRVSGELEQKSNLLSNAEETIQSVTADKNQIERELNEKIQALAQERDTFAGEHAATKDTLSDESERRKSLESDIGVLTLDKAQMEKIIRDYSIDIENLKLALETVKTESQDAEEKAQATILEKTRFEADLQQRLEAAETRSKQQATEQEQLNADLSAEKERRTASEQWIETLLQEKMQREATLGAEKSSLVEQRNTLQEKFDATTASLGAERQKNESLAEEIKKAKEAKELLESNMRTLLRRLDIAGTALEEEKQLRLIAEKSHKESGTAQSASVQAMEKECSDLQEKLQALQSELAVVSNERATLKNARKALEDELAAAVGGRAQSEKLARSISYEMEQVRADLENERRQQRVLEENLKEIALEKNRVEENMQAVAAENTRQITSGITSIQKLKTEMETILVRQRSLEEQLKEAISGREEKEQALNNLSDTCESMQATLKEEKEKRYAVLEDLAAARQALENYRHAHDIIILPSATPDESQAISLKEPALPQVIKTVSQSLTTPQTTSAHPEPVSSERVNSPVPDQEPMPLSQDVDDLFETHDEMDVGDLPDATPESRVEDSVGVDIPPADPAVFSEDDKVVHNPDGPAAIEIPPKEPDDDHDFPAPEMAESPAEEPEITEHGDVPDQVPDDENTGDATSADIGTPGEYNVGIPQGRLQFNRGHWFELVKWAHATPELSHEEKLRIVRIGRLIQRGGQLTPRQEEQISDVIALACSRGYVAR
jgi:DNA-binding response OmpR family regulator